MTCTRIESLSFSCETRCVGTESVEVDLTGLQRRQRRRRFGDEPVGHPGNARRAVPEVGIGAPKRCRIAARRFHERERPGADRMRGDRTALDVLALHDGHALETAEVGQQVRRGTAQREDDGARVRAVTAVTALNLSELTRC